MIILKHKVIKDFQLITDDKKIIVLKSGSILEDYKYGNKKDYIKIDVDIILNNPEYFQIIDWKAELLSFMRSNKIPQPAIIFKKIIPFLEEMSIIKSNEPNPDYLDLEEKLQKSLKKQKELENELELKISRQLNTTEIENMEEELRNKLKKIRDRESELDSNEVSILKKQMELDILLKNEKIKIDEKSKDIESKELELKKKLRDIQLQEEKIREYEVELKKKEREIDGVIISSEKDIGEKHNELYNKIRTQLKELEEKEKVFNEKVDIIEDRERELFNLQDKLDAKSKLLENMSLRKKEEIELEFSKRKREVLDKEMEYMGKVRKVKSMLINISVSIPWGILPSNLKSDMDSILKILE